MKRRVKWAALALIVCAAVGTAGVLWLKPDWRFLLAQQVQGIFSRLDLEELDWQEEKLRVESVDGLKEEAGESQALLLVNESHPVPENFTPDLREYKDSGVLMQREVLENYEALAEAVKKECGDQLFVKSSYRDREDQQEEYEADPVVAAVPGTSEHETGLALDVYVAGYAGYGFLKSEAGQYVNSHCWEYGFIIRYPLGSQEETGIPFEPWHLRYVGKPHAEIIEKNGWTLEEYLNRLELGELYQVGECFVSRQQLGGLTLPAGAGDVMVSADNCGNCVVWGRLADGK